MGLGQQASRGLANVVQLLGDVRPNDPPLPPIIFHGGNQFFDFGGELRNRRFPQLRARVHGKSATVVVHCI